MDAVTDSRSTPDSTAFEAILGHLGREICRPLDLLQQGIGSLLADSDEQLTEPERTQATTMLILCDELDRLTRHYLGTPDQADG
jgi:hypothetical protein